MKLVAWVTLTIVIASAAASAQTLAPELKAAPASAKLPSAPMRFGFPWNAPCRVPATRLVERPKTSLGGGGMSTFTVVVAAADANLTVHFENAKLIQIEGQAPGSDQDKIAANTLEIAFTPPLQLSRDGHFEKAIEIDASLDAALATSQADERTKTALTGAMKTSRRRGLEGRAKTYWKVWFETWANLQITPGKTVERPDTIDIDVDRASAPLHVVHLGAVAGAANLALLEATQAVEGADAIRLLAPILKGPPGARSLPTPRAARIDYRMTAAIEPGTGRVHRVRWVSTFDIDGRKLVSSGDTAFDWSHAVGCSTAH